jgi:hypothetical protein
VLMPDGGKFPVRLPVRIVGRDLPGLRFAGYEPVYVGLKRGANEAEGVSPADARQVVFDLYVDLKPDRAGELDYRGPYIAGLGKHDRAIGVVWCVLTDDDRYVLFRGAKVRLPPIDGELLHGAAEGDTLQATVSLTGDSGGPITARIPEAKIRWEFRPTAAEPPADSARRVIVSREQD